MTYDYIITKPELCEETLAHYGVKGMKWKYHKSPGSYPNSAYGVLQKRDDIESLVDKAKLVGKKGSKASSAKGAKEKSGSSKAAKEPKEKKEKEETKNTKKTTKSVSTQQLANAKAVLAKANTSKLDQIRESLKLTSPRRKSKYDEIKETQEKLKRTKK